METTVKLPSKPRVIYSPLAWTKQQLLLFSQEGEIGWYGTVEVIEENTYRIKDILVCPQVVGKARVRTDENYDKWFESLSDEEVNSLRADFHSHVNMSPTPSKVDERNREDLLASWKPEKAYFYIWMIWNKRLEYTGDIYDSKTGIHWGTKDITVEIEGIGEPNKWLEKVTEEVKEEKEVTVWNLVKVKSSLIRPMSPVYTYSGAGVSGAPSQNYWHGSV